MPVMFQHRLERLSCRLTELGVDFWVPLVNPGQKLIESRQERREAFGVPAFSFAGVVVGDQCRRLLKMIPTSPSDDEGRIALGRTVRVTDPPFLGYI